MEGSMVSLGIPRPNLVIVFDNEKRFEFRVQCEVPVLDEKVALALVKLLQADEVGAMNEAKNTIMKIVEAHKKPPITAVSRRIIATAFDASIEFLKSKSS